MHTLMMWDEKNSHDTKTDFMSMASYLTALGNQNIETLIDNHLKHLSPHLFKSPEELENEESTEQIEWKKPKNFEETKEIIDEFLRIEEALEHSGTS